MSDETISTAAVAPEAPVSGVETPPAIALTDVRHYYGSRTALAGISLSIMPREIFGLVGPNGGGKTTLFRILATLMRPTAGEATIQGLDVVRQPEAVRERLGVVFQTSSLDSVLTVRENLEYHGHLYGLRGRALRNRVDEVLVLFSLEARKQDRVGILSGGQKRRVEVAKGMLHKPAVLILDEPSTGLDPGARRDLWGLLVALRDQAGTTVLLTTHFMDEADRCDRVAILDRGNVVALGRPDVLKAEIGGDVLTVVTRSPERLSGRIAERFGHPSTVVDSAVRIDHPAGHTFVPQLVEAFPGEIDSVTIGKPVLEDVFFLRTGHRFQAAAS